MTDVYTDNGGKTTLPISAPRSLFSRLFQALEDDDVNAIEMLLPQCKRAAMAGKPLLHRAQSGAAARLLLEHGADLMAIDSYGTWLTGWCSHNIFLASARRVNTDILKLYLDAAAQVPRLRAESVVAAADARGLTGFTTDIADLVVSYLPNPMSLINDTLPGDPTPLMNALKAVNFMHCNFHPLANAWLLIKAGADPNITDHLGDTALSRFRRQCGWNNYKLYSEEEKAQTLEMVSYLESVTTVVRE